MASDEEVKSGESRLENAGKTKVGTIQNAVSQPQNVTGYEKCTNAVTDRVNKSHTDPTNSGMP